MNDGDIVKFFLPSPTHANCHLVQKGQIGHMPIYYCRQSKTFWLLKMQITGARYLVQYKCGVGIIDPETCIEVPEKWKGDPQTIGIDVSTWQDFHVPDYATHLEGIKALIRQGDFIALIDEEHRVTHHVTLNDQDELVQNPID